MPENNFNFQNPLMRMGFENDDILPEGGFGAVLARAGVGKTSFLVQMALYTMFRKKHILHISLDDHVNKISLWYKEVFKNFAQKHNISSINQVWETLLPHRLIMTFKVDSFTLPRFKERLTDLIEQKIFLPNVILIDGLEFNSTSSELLTELKEIAQKHGLRIWFTVRIHRHEDPGSDGIPVQIADAIDLFDTALQLQPEGKDVHVKVLKGVGNTAPADLLIDPATMLMMEK